MPRLLTLTFLVGCAAAPQPLVNSSALSSTSEVKQRLEKKQVKWRGYDPPMLEHSADVRNVVSVVGEYAASRGWQILESNADIGIIEVVSRTFEREGNPARERWSFFVNAREVRGWRYVEVASDPHAAGLWVKEYTKSVSNGYTQERGVLAAIKTVLKAKRVKVASVTR